ncbi:hypothetical protein M569_07477 [Genlisea aurea]|uniref:Uncharacterized protein n=1 Tax=Genlisea aurea TaxID=192259 RepID=S8CKR2_9LAMI|nr:hypothetical protein M569_07477 [Genlisea aurea]
MKMSMPKSPESSARSTTTADFGGNPSEMRDSSYFPGCRKDANCSCEICIASINATLDLIPRSSLTKLSTSRRSAAVRRSPVPFASSEEEDASTPDSAAPQIEKSTGTGEFREKDLSRAALFRWFIFALIFALGLEYGVSPSLSRVLHIETLSSEIVQNLGERSVELEGLNPKIEFLSNELAATIPPNRISNCSSVDSPWKINQDATLLISQCVLYESLAEKVTIWGWPLQVSGLLTSHYSSRSFTLLSGNITLWSGYGVATMNGSWRMPKWTSYGVHLDPDTWILEHRKGFLVENSGLVSSSGELFKFILGREFRKMKDEFLMMMPSFWSHDDAEAKRLIPT